MGKISITVDVKLRTAVALLCAGVIAWTLAASPSWAQKDSGADTKCRYDFARRKMVCEPVEAKKPANAVPVPAPSASAPTSVVPKPELTTPDQATPGNTPDNADYGLGDQLDSSYESDSTVARIREPNSPVELRVVGLRPPRKLPMREGPSRRDFIIGNIPSRARGIQLIDCPTRNWCKVTYRDVAGFISRKFVEPVDPNVAWERNHEPRYRVARVPLNDTLNVRRGPSMETPIVGRIPADARGITLRGRCRYEWCPIKYGRVRGWAGSYYLARDN